MALSTLNNPTDARPASGRQTDRHDAVLQGPEPLTQQQAEQAALREQGEKPHRQPGREAVRPQKGLGLFPLMFLDGDDLRHPLRRDLPGGGVDGGGVVAAREHRAQVIGGDQGIPQRHVDPLPPVGRHRVRRVPQEQQAGGRPGLQAADDDIQQHRVLERFGVRPQVRGQVGRGAVQQLLGEPVRPGGPQVPCTGPSGWSCRPTAGRRPSGSRP